MKKLLAQLIGGIIGIFLAVEVLDGVLFSGPIEGLILLGAIIGLLNAFAKPILKIVALPFRIITLGLFDIVINMAMVWGATILYPVLEIPHLFDLFLATLIVWLASSIMAKIVKDK